ncbi:DUF504 domain-containing protein [Candidatus Woesearchaeota archaeon]|nr:MAG: DUF504 domain-containing protein [Candidatus Woesearchaeota archaeon]
MKFYQIREEDRQFFYALLYGTGIILFWRGIWEVSYEIPLLENVYFCLFVGLFILTITGYMYREFDPLSAKMNKISKLLHDVIREHKRGDPHEIYYRDDIGGHSHKILPHKIKRIEHDLLVCESDGHELFIPLSRVHKVHKQGKTIWKR